MSKPPTYFTTAVIVPVKEYEKVQKILKSEDNTFSRWVREKMREFLEKKGEEKL